MELLARRSCRAFKPEPVPHGLIEQIVRSAGRAPSWCNTQPWHLTLSAGTETDRFRRGLSEYAATHSYAPDLPFPDAYRGVYLQRRRDVGWQLYDSVGVRRGDREASARQAAKNFELFGAPHVAILTTEADLGVYGAIDCGLFLQTFLLAAEALGVAAIPQAAIAGCAPFVREFFSLPEHRLIVCGISLGWSESCAPANSFVSGRAPLDDIRTWHEGPAPTSG